MQTLYEFMCTEIYFPVIDTALAELGRRFSANNIAMLHAVCALMPGSDNFLDADIGPIWLSYGCTLQIQH